MMLRSADRVERENVDPRSLALSSAEFFLLDQIQGSPTVREVISHSGLPPEQAKGQLSRLVELGTLRVQKQKLDLPSRQGKSTPNRLARRLSAALEASKDSVDQEPCPTDAPRAAKREPTTEPESRPSAEIAFEPATADDPRIIPDLPLSVDRQRDVLATLDRLPHMNHFEVLRIMPTSDSTAIKRAYHKLTRHLHPDAYYGKDLGEFAERLATVFTAVKQSYELLMGSQNRDEYIERLLKVEKAKRAEVEATAEEHRVAREREKEMARALEAEHQAAQERAEREAERERWKRENAGRGRRDRARSLRMSARLLGADLPDKRAARYHQCALRELDAGNDSAAAGLMRLALDLDPDNAVYQELWTDRLASVGTQDASKARACGDRLVDQGEFGDAVIFYERAALADRTPLNLALAAKALAAADQREAAHRRAMAAVQSLARDGTSDQELDPSALEARCELAEAFLCLDQPATAAAQLRLVLGRDPDHDRARALNDRV